MLIGMRVLELHHVALHAVADRRVAGYDLRAELDRLLADAIGDQLRL